MKIDFHINYCGNCEEAFRFYQSIFGGELHLLSYKHSNSKRDLPEGWGDKIVHGSITIHNLNIAGADVFPEEYIRPQGFHLLLQIESKEECRRLFDALSQQGSTTMPLQETFWSQLYGIVVDQYGISWEINFV